MAIVYILLMALVLAGCGTNPGSDTEEAAGSKNNEEEIAGELNLFNWSEYMPDSVIEKFEEEYGVKVNYSTYSSNEEMLAKINAGGLRV
ncbi:hypothetical protein ACFSCZ_04380 [Siminovitchia sediminis]|uniref:Spermidine/putrescine ABC transporter substrate-binding protein n=1 Tax=Siminovitchia sediminis TaxID=1274353 RepID=A0ABW4KDV7_9BACI